MEFRGSQVGNKHTWGFFGGGIEEGEDPVAAIKRELREEIGLQTSVFNDVSRTAPNVWIFTKIVDDEFDPILSFESESYRWCSDFPDQRVHPKIAKSMVWLSEYVKILRRQIGGF